MKTVLLVFVAGLAALCLYLTRSAQTAQLENEIAAARAERDALAGENRTVLQQLEEARTERAAAEKTAVEAKSRESSKANNVQDPFLKKLYALVDNAAAIYEHFEKTPESMIPELDLITESDWLELAEWNSHLSTPEDVQRALALVRIRAKQHCLSALIHASVIYSGDLPLRNVEQLKPFLSKSITDEMLARYEIPDESQWAEIARAKLGASEIKGGERWWVLCEKAVPPGAFDNPAYLIINLRGNGHANYSDAGWSKRAIIITDHGRSK